MPAPTPASAMQYISVPDQDFGKGTDARSAVNQIQPGFVQDLLNADIIQSYVRKRAGYQSYAGNLPIRIARLDYIAAGNQMLLTLDSPTSIESPVSLESLRSSPLIVYGKSSNQTVGPITKTNSGHYYSAFTVPTRKVLLASSNDLLISQDEHGLSTANMFVNVVESTSTVDRSYSSLNPNSITINTSTYGLDINYTTYQDTNAYVYFSNQTPLAGQSYTASVSHAGGGAQTFSIPTSTHNLVSFNIVSQIYQAVGSTVVQVEPDSFLLDTSGNVTVGLNSEISSTFYILLSAAPVANIATGVVNAGAIGTVTIPNLTKPWIFYNIYLEQTPGGIKEQVLPDSFVYDDTTASITLTFNNGTNTSRNFIVLYEYGYLKSNQIRVTDSAVTANGTDLAPQLTIWGLNHNDLYPVKTAREGWVNHIDTYRRNGEQRVVTGLGGNLYADQSYSEAATPYLYPILIPSLQSRTAATIKVGPLFYDTEDTPGRTRGYITSDSSGTNWVKCMSVQYDTGSGQTIYTLSIPNKQILDSTGTVTTLASVISTTADMQDYITIQNMSYKKHEGTFKILQAVDGTDQIQVWVQNDANSVDYNDSNTAGDAGVFTDQINWLSQSNYLPLDSLYESGSSFSAVVYSSLGTTTVVGGLSDLTQLPGGLVMWGSRQSDTIPLRQSLPTLTRSVDNLVVGDMLSYTGIARQIRVNYINSAGDINISISGTGTTATATLLTGDTSYLQEGHNVILLNAGSYSGSVTVNSIIGISQFTFASTSTETISSAILSGKTIQIDEQLSWADSNGDLTAFEVTDRWIPIEGPVSTDALPVTTHPRYFNTDDYSNQSFIRSTMVNDNLYLTNSKDEVMKYDGSSLYRAGLPQWQPGLFMTQDTGATARIVTGLLSMPYTAIIAGEGKVQIDASSLNTIPVGSTVLLSGSDIVYTLASYSSAGTPTVNYAIMTQALDSNVAASGTAYQSGVYKYYLRLNMVDFNDNIIASAMTSSGDMAMQMSADAAITLKLVGLPPFDNYDYNRIEVQIYRTKLLIGTTAPTYYLITTLPLNFNNTTGYVQYTDTFADTDISNLDTLSSVAGAELGINWREPIRSKYITTADNRLILGNLTDYPSANLNIVGAANLVAGDFADQSVFILKQTTDTGTTTDNINRIRFQWKAAPTGTASSFSIGTNQFSFTTSTASGASTGDWVYLSYSSVATTGRNLTYSGWWQIASVSGTTITINLTGATGVTYYPNTYTFATVTSDVPVLMTTDGNLGQYNGETFGIFNATRRMALAINSVMRQVDVSLTGMSSFTPWIMARSGNDLSAAGQLLLRASKVESVLFGLSATFSGYNVFINSQKVTSGTLVSSVQQLFPSRILISYPNFPELYDSPESIQDTNSASAIDVNPSDGQEITGIIPFFGEAAFTAAQQTSVLVVFKANSIYLVDPTQKASGGTVVQRLETQGLGCTAPFSIAGSKNGIMFANNSGVYRLNRTQTIQYIGQYMERNWINRVDLSNLELIHGHHYGVGRRYKVSVPLLSTQDATTGYQEPSEVYVYDHTQEDYTLIVIGTLPVGSWGRYDNHQSLGWANLNSDAFWASTGGQVFKIRTTGLAEDFRDDSSPINFQLTTRPNDMGSPGTRKVLDKIIVHYKTSLNTTSNSLLVSVDLDQEFTTTTPFKVNGSSTTNTGIGDIVGKDIISIRHSVDRRRGVYFTVQISNNIIDQDIQVAGLAYSVGNLTTKGITSAGQT